MIVVWLILVLFIGGLIAWALEKYNAELPRLVAVIALGIDLLLLINLAMTGQADSEGWLVNSQWQWIPSFGIGVHFGIDNLSLLMCLLTVFLGMIAVGSAWVEINKRSGFFYFNLLWTLAGVLGIFTSLDLMLFFFFWEVMLIPMYFIISIWGHENCRYAAMKFFIFTQSSGLLLLLSIVVLAIAYHTKTGQYSFDYFTLLAVASQLNAEMAYWLMLGFFIAFAVKLPGVPFHNWLPDAHSQAPTAGSVILAGVLLKTGAYGFIRFVIPLFPEAAQEFSTIGMTLGMISILYGALLAFAQSDLKRLIAYTSISHMGFVLLGVFSFTPWGTKGAVMTMLAHGMTSAALFALAGGIQHRIHTRDMSKMGGVWSDAPRMGAIALFFSIASLGMPGLANFIGEFLVLVGAYQSNILLTALSAIGLITASVYSLIVIQKVFHGEKQAGHTVADLGGREMLFMGAMAVVTIYLGLYPQPALEMVGESLDHISKLMAGRTG